MIEVGDAYLLQGDCLDLLRNLPQETIDCCVTSPPYWGLRDYGHEGQLGLEPTPEAYVQNMVEVFREVRRVLKPTGTLWLNLGDSYARQGGRTSNVPRHWDGRQHDPGGLHDKRALASDFGAKPKDLVGIPWRVAFALQADGWYLRQDIIWHKPNPMPESVTDRCTKSHEYLFLLAKSERYFYDHEAVKEPAIHAGRLVKATGGEAKNAQHAFAGETKAGFTTHDTLVSDTRNRRDVWTIPTKPFKGAHFAVMPEALAEPCILAGCPVGGLVLDPFAGSGTVGAVAVKHDRGFVGFDLNPEYLKLAEARIREAYARA